MSEETTAVQPASPPAELGGIVGADYLHRGTAADTVDGIQPEWVIEPGSAEEVAEVLRYAHTAGLHVAPRGSGTKMGWGNPPRAVELVLSTRRLDHVLEHAWGDMTATVEAGCTLADLQRVL